jgi:hypothetical protein
VHVGPGASVAVIAAILLVTVVASVRPRKGTPARN